MERVLIVGAGGMLARDLIGEAPSGVELVTRASRELDVTNERSVRATIENVAPAVVLNCAAYTDVDGAENDRERAFAVNGTAPGLLAAALAGFGQRSAENPLLVHFSSDYVFDGTGTRAYAANDRVSPLGAYGASKLAGEVSIARHAVRSVILRTQWLYGVHGRSFPRTMWERAAAGLPTKVVTDQTGRPTYTIDLARATWQLVGTSREQRSSVVLDGAARVLHVANDGIATWYEVAQHVFARAGRTDLLSPCTTEDFPRPARRPAFSVLDTSDFESIVKRPLPHWKDALDRFLDELRT